MDFVHFHSYIFPHTPICPTLWTYWVTWSMTSHNHLLCPCFSTIWNPIPPNFFCWPIPTQWSGLGLNTTFFPLSWIKWNSSLLLYHSVPFWSCLPLCIILTYMIPDVTLKMKIILCSSLCLKHTCGACLRVCSVYLHMENKGKNKWKSEWTNEEGYLQCTCLVHLTYGVLIYVIANSSYLNQNYNWPSVPAGCTPRLTIFENKKVTLLLSCPM